MEADHSRRSEVQHRGRGPRLAGPDEGRQGAKALLSRGVRCTAARMSALARRELESTDPVVLRAVAARLEPRTGFWGHRLREADLKPDAPARNSAQEFAQLIATTGCSRSRMGPARIHTPAVPATAAPTMSVGTTPIWSPMAPPRNDPIGIVPQTIVRIVAFILPCTRSGVMV